jgi:hypothetical protein
MATVGPVCFMEGFAVSSKRMVPSKECPRTIRILDPLVQQNPIRSLSLYRSTVAVFGDLLRTRTQALSTFPDHAWRAQRGDCSQVSFAIEPIQLPIVPLNLFWSHRLRHHHRRVSEAPTGPPWLRGGGAEPRTESQGP